MVLENFTNHAGSVGGRGLIRNQANGANNQGGGGLGGMGGQNDEDLQTFEIFIHKQFLEDLNERRMR